jgi:hypothetical protein
VIRSREGHISHDLGRSTRTATASHEVAFDRSPLADAIARYVVESYAGRNA